MNRYPPIFFSWLLLVAILIPFTPLAGVEPEKAVQESPLQDARKYIKEGRSQQALLILQTFLIQNPSEPYRHQAQFIMGKTLAALGRHPEARQYFQEAAPAPSPAKDYLLFYLYQDYDALGQKDQAQKTLEELIATYPASPLAGQARLSLAKLYQTAGLSREALRLLEAASSESLEARYLWGEILKSRNPAAALKIFRSLYLQYPASPWAQKSQSAAQSLGQPIMLGEKESFTRARRLTDGGHYTLAARQWTDFLTRFPQSSRRWQARLQLGEAQFKGRRYSAAIKTLQEVVNRGPLSLRGEGLFWLGWAGLRTSQEKIYRQAFTQLFQRYPQNPQVGRALYLWGRTCEDEKEEELAEQAYAQLLKSKCGSGLEEEGFWRRGWVLFKKGRYAEAAQSWRELLRTYPQSPSALQARYWLGRVYEREDNLLLARMAYQELMQRDAGGYYGWLAQERWLLLNPDTPEAKMPAASSAGGVLGFTAIATSSDSPTGKGEVTSPLQTIDTQFLARQEELAALDLEPAAAAELNTLAKTLPFESPAWQEIFKRFYSLNAPDKAVYWAKKLLRQGQAGFLLQKPQYLYPKVYWPQILAGARKTGLDPYLILSVVREESAFGTQVVSSAGAHGLMQLLHDTAGKVARQENISFNPEEIYRPDLNITLGSRYLADMVAEMGSVPLALAAYNAGPHKVRAWKVDWKKKQEEYLEDIPYDETRNYVKRILNTYRIYRALYGDTPDTSGVNNLTVIP
jgi:soluble lytic murein transglycosylase